MQYGDWTFYLACWAIAQIALLVASFADPHLRTLRKSRPWMWQALVLGLTTVALYGSDSNKPEPPKPPVVVNKIRVYVHRGNGGGRWVPIGVNTVEKASVKINNIEQVEVDNGNQ